MQLRLRSIAAISIVVLAVGCETTSSPSTNGGTEQLRASLTPSLRRAGVSDACIQQLQSSTLAQVKGITSNSARSSREVLQRQQRIRTAVSKDCPTI